MRTRRIFKHALFAAALGLALPATAAAQQADDGYFPERTDRYEDQWERQRQQQPAQRDAERERFQRQQQEQERVQGTIEGVVTGIDLQQGLVTLMTEDRPITLRATPHQVANLRLGQQVSTEYAILEGRVWMTEDYRQRLDLGELGESGQVTGQVVDIDESTGIVTVQTRERERQTYRAHPLELQQLSSGQQVRLRYQEVGNIRWIDGFGASFR